MKKTIALLSIAALMTGCATTQGYGASYAPVIDRQGIDLNRYYADLDQCRQYAQQVDAAGNAANAAFAGALFGAVLGAIAGGGHRFNTQMAGAGALGAGTGAAAGSMQKQQIIIMRCLQGRNYKVLG